jgi:SAM-dependent methyltransferase
VAADYNRYRPTPPAAALDWLLPAGAADVVDIGAGTGALTRLLVGRVSRVYAVEPDPRMRAVLAADSPTATALEGSGEAIPLPDHSADAVLAASAWHWMDADRAVPEIARVLRPGGRFGLLWNTPDRSVPWIADLGAVSRGEAGGERAADRSARVGYRAEQISLPDGAPFTGSTTILLRWERPIPVADLPGLFGTYSEVIVRPPAERAEILDRIAAAAAVHPDLAGRTEVALPMTCSCFRADRT